MGNVHSIMQIAPLVSIEGAALPVRSDKVAAFDARYVRDRKVPRYVWRHRAIPQFTISNVNLWANDVSDPGHGTVYLVISGGGKWGYDDEFNEFLRDVAPFLEDAKFFLGDEDVLFIDEYTIARGTLTIERVIEAGGSLVDDTELLIRDDAARYLPFCLQQSRLWRQFSEPEGGLRWIDKAIALMPHAWEPHLERAQILGMHAGHLEAIASLERARACLGPFVLKPWGAANEPELEVENDLDHEITRALQRIECELGNQLAAMDRFDEACAAYDRSFAIRPPTDNSAPMTNKGGLLVRRGRFDEAEVCFASAMSLATTTKEIAAITYNRARLAARRGDPEQALVHLRLALELSRDYQRIAAADDDLATLRGNAAFAALMR